MPSSSSASNVWHFHPSLAANTVVAILFAIIGLVHLCVRLRLHASFFNALVVGCLFEVVGYVARAAGSKYLSSVGLYAVQVLFLLLAPVLFAATCYLILGRIIYATKAEALSIVPRRWLNRIFITADVISFVVQLAGGALQTAHSSPSLRNIGKWLVVATLSLQITIFGIFCYITAAFHRSLNRNTQFGQACANVPWRRCVKALYVASALIIIRSVVRIAEYAEGWTGWIITHEFMLLVFDAAPMFLLLIGLLVVHPARLLNPYLKGFNSAERMNQDITESPSMMLG